MIITSPSKNVIKYPDKNGPAWLKGARQQFDIHYELGGVSFAEEDQIYHRRVSDEGN